MEALVSFIIAAYNEEKFIVECVESCLLQTYPSVEVVITDDGSTDETVSIIRKKYLKEKRVKLISPSKKIGKAAAFNSSFAAAKGEFIALMGADDINYPERIATQITFLNSFDLVFCDLERVDSLNKSTIKKYMFGSGTMKIKEINFDSMIYSPIGNGSILMNRKVAEKVFPLPTDLLHEDYWIPLLSSFFGKISYFDKPLYKYRIHENNTSGIFNNQNKIKNIVISANRDYIYYKNVLQFFNEQNLFPFKFFIESKIFFLKPFSQNFMGDSFTLGAIKEHLESLKFEITNKKILFNHLIKQVYLFVLFRKWNFAKEILRKVEIFKDRNWIELRVCVFFKIGNPEILKHSFFLRKGISLICKLALSKYGTN